MSKPERLQLDATSWVDVWRGWHRDGGATFAELAKTLPWRQARLWRYDHYVTEPRLGASLKRAEHPVLRDTFLLLRKTYAATITNAGTAQTVDFDGPALAYYRTETTRWAPIATAICATPATPWWRS